MKKKKAAWKNSRGALGLPLSRRAFRVLRGAGILSHSIVTVGHQELAQRQVVRGIESGGAARDVGWYVTFADQEGNPIESLHPVESIAVNSLHAVVVAPSFVRVEMVRKAHTYDLLITRHAPGQAGRGNRPILETDILFRGHHGRVEVDLAGKDKAEAGTVEPTFYGLSGEPVQIPEKFRPAVRAITRAVNCINCSHSHYVIAPKLPVANSTTQPPNLEGQREVAV
jgi:hypothetical protein